MTIRSATTITLLAAAGMLAACDTDHYNSTSSRNSGYYRDRDGYYTRDTYRDQGTSGDNRYGTYPPNEGASDYRNADSGQWQYDRGTGRYYDSTGRSSDSSRYNTSRPYDSTSYDRQNRPYYDPNRPSSQPYDSRYQDQNRQYDNRYYDQYGRPYNQNYSGQNYNGQNYNQGYNPNYDPNRSGNQYYDQYGRPYNQYNQNYNNNPNYDNRGDQGRFPYDRKYYDNDRTYNDPNNPGMYSNGRPTDDPRGLRSNKEPGAAYDARGSETRVGAEPGTGTGDTRTTTGDTRTRMDTTNQPRTGDQAAIWGDRTPDQRILSILHAKNQEEIQAGRLAQQQGSSDAVKRYGERLVRDHTDNDNKVTSVARTANVTLMDTEEVNRMMAREKGEPEAKDPLADLKSKTGAEFDRAFSQKMRQGHSDLIRAVESAQNNVKNDSVRDFLKQTLPTLRDHEKMANDLPQSE